MSDDHREPPTLRLPRGALTPAEPTRGRPERTPLRPLRWPLASPAGAGLRAHAQAGGLLPVQQKVPRRVLLLTLGAMLLYGGIAALANRAHGPEPMLRAALVQGLSCGVTTFGLSTLIDRSVVWLALRRRAAASAAALSALAAMALGCTLHVAVNLWAGTPELLATVAVPALALAVYCPLYAAAAARRLR